MRGAHWQLKTKRRSITIGVNKYINPIILVPHCDIQSSVLNKLQITNDCQLKVKAKGIIRRDYLRIWRNCSTFAVAFGN